MGSVHQFRERSSQPGLKNKNPTIYCLKRIHLKQKTEVESKSKEKAWPGKCGSKDTQQQS